MLSLEWLICVLQCEFWRRFAYRIITNRVSPVDVDVRNQSLLQLHAHSALSTLLVFIPTLSCGRPSEKILHNLYTGNFLRQISLHVDQAVVTAGTFKFGGVLLVF